MPAMKSGYLFPASLASLSLIAACSLINAPQERVTPKDSNASSGSGGGTGGGTGTCVEPFTTLTDCGKCGVACKPANVDAASCKTGKCTYGSCAGKFLECDNDLSNGCEVDGDSDAANCGMCNKACSKAGIDHANVVCAKGACDYDKCAPLFADCDGNRKNGCERPANTLADCGDCDKPCAPKNASVPTCTDGKCKYASCDPGFQDCDNDTTNGCESDKTGDPAHCGDCMTMCKAGDTCFGGKCGAVGKSCKDILDKGGSKGDGKYLIAPDGDIANAFQVYCDMTADMGGWTLLTWTGDSAAQPFGVPYPGVAPCPTLDCKRGSLPQPRPQQLFGLSKEFMQSMTPMPVASFGAIKSYTYAGKYTYQSLAGITLNYGQNNCVPGLQGVFFMVNGPANYNGKPMFLAQALGYASYNYAADANGYIWNIGAPNMFCDGTGQVPGTWMGPWSQSQYGPALSNSPGSFAVWVR